MAYIKNEEKMQSALIGLDKKGLISLYRTLRSAEVTRQSVFENGRIYGNVDTDLVDLVKEYERKAFGTILYADAKAAANAGGQYAIRLPHKISYKEEQYAALSEAERKDVDRIVHEVCEEVSFLIDVMIASVAL